MEKENSPENNSEKPQQSNLSEEDIRPFLQEGLTAGRVVSWVWYIQEDLFKGSENVANLFSVDPEELVRGMPLSAITSNIHEEDRERVKKAINKAIETGEHYAEDYRVRTSGGEIRWVAARGIVEYDKDNKPARFPGVIIDITERKRAEAALAHLSAEVNRERRLYNTILSATPDQAFVFDLDYRLKFANKAMLEMLGLSFEVVEGKKLAEIGFNEWQAEMHEREFDQAVETKKPVRGEVSFSHAKQGERIYDYIFVPILNDEQEVEAVAGTVRDITEREKHKEDLKELNRDLERRVEERTQSLLSYQKKLRSLASQLSKAEEQERQRLATELHDNLGQMIAVCKMKLSDLQNDPLPEQSASKVEGVKEVLQDAMVYTRTLMSELKPPPTLDKEDIRTTINWVAERMEKHGLQVEVKAEDEALQVESEIKTTLLQSVRELLFNIVKHAEVEEARVRIVRPDGHVKIVVEDEGKGFDPEATNTDYSDDGGFGLFNIGERLDLLGGDMEIESKPGEGTTVVLSAPLKEED